jgi:hypothetical protein
VGLSSDKENVRFAKTKVTGRALEYWNSYASLYFRCNWSPISCKKKIKDDLRIIYSPQYYEKKLSTPIFSWQFSSSKGHREAMEQAVCCTI